MNARRRARRSLNVRTRLRENGESGERIPGIARWLRRTQSESSSPTCGGPPNEYGHQRSTTQRIRGRGTMAYLVHDARQFGARSARSLLRANGHLPGLEESARASFSLRARRPRFLRPGCFDRSRRTLRSQEGCDLRAVRLDERLGSDHGRAAAPGLGLAFGAPLRSPDRFGTRKLLCQEWTLAFRGRAGRGA